MDGVLVDATEWHYEALNRALRLFGYTITREEHLGRYNGRPTKVKLQMLTEEKGLPKSLHTLINELKQKYTAEEIEKQCRPDLEKIKMLRSFGAQHYKIIVCSNAIRSSVQIMLKNSGLLEYCLFYLSNEDVEYPKPSPEIYIKAIKKLELDPTECLIIEDSPLGIQAAKASGARIMGVKNFHEVTYKNVREAIEHYDKISRKG
ncbi:HAD family phosphatase [Candidatus Micrarchaeota archaeon]|nr:HAD family phosphatase [Candidatus Micrarchaeota archaeon]